MPWPARTAICLDCRTALPDAATPCPAAPSHRVRSLHDAGGRDELLEEVWGPKNRRHRLLTAGKVGATGAGGGSFVQACTGCDVPDDLDVFLVFVALFVVIAGIWYLGSWWRDRARRRRVLRSASGARRPGPAVPRTGQIGRVVARTTELEALTNTPCVAFGVVLVQDDTRVLLRDGATVGFDVELATGERVRIPAGACIVERSRATTTRGLDRYRDGLDPRRRTAGDLEPFPCERAAVATLVDGQQVEIASELAIEPAGQAGTYREGAASLLVPRGIVRLRPC